MNTVTTSASAATIDLSEATACIWLEADLLDGRDFDAWLGLWSETGIYAIPTDRAATDFAATLNYAYDDAAMRAMRVKRLQNGHAVSSTPAPVTIRTVSRFRVLSSDAGSITVRGAQHLWEYKLGRSRFWAADVTWRLVRTAEGLKIEEKVIRFIDAGDALMAMAFLP